MATITKRSEGKWQGQVRRKGYGTFTKVHPSKPEAVKWARQIEADIDRGLIKPTGESSMLTFKQALLKYSREVTPLKKSSEHQMQRIAFLSPLIKFMDTPLDEIRPLDICKFKDSRLAMFNKGGKKLTGSAVNRDLAMISHVFTVAVKSWGYESLSNPVKGIQKPKESKARSRRVETVAGVSELDLILSEIRSPVIKLAYLLLVELACRRGELAKLQWADVDLGNRFLVFHDTKNSETRTVPLSFKAVELFQAMKDLTGHEERVLNIPADYLSFHWQSAKKRAGVKGLRLHDLRREGISRLFEQTGMNTLEVAAISGHKTLAMLQVYSKLKTSHLLAKLDSANVIATAKQTAIQSSEVQA